MYVTGFLHTVDINIVIPHQLSQLREALCSIHSPHLDDVSGAGCGE